MGCVAFFVCCRLFVSLCCLLSLSRSARSPVPPDGPSSRGLWTSLRTREAAASARRAPPPPLASPPTAVPLVRGPGRSPVLGTGYNVPHALCA